MRCGNRRAAVCPSCSREYKGDAWHVLACGLMGGKDVPETVRDHPATFVTLTAPSFGAVHRATDPGKGGRRPPCRARRDKPVCPHGRPLYCFARHDRDDPITGQALCFDCYDYIGHAIWQWWAPELWRYFTQSLRRHLAKAANLTQKDFAKRRRIAYGKVTELQARGLAHMHAAFRLDGPDGPQSPPDLAITVEQLEQAVREAAAHVVVDAPAPGGDVLRLRWGTELDTRTITPGAGRDNREGPAHPEQVAAYLSKYLTKGVEAFGLPVGTRIRSAMDACHVGATEHAIRIIAAAHALSAVHEGYRLIGRYLGTLGYRGHPITKSRRYSVTFGELRSARRTWRRRRARLNADATVRDVLDTDPATEDEADTIVTLGTWTYAGRCCRGVVGLGDRGRVMARAPLPLGTWGKIRVYVAKVDDAGKPVGHVARTLYRDFDGRTRPVEAHGKTKTAATNALRTKLTERAKGGRGGELTATPSVLRRCGAVHGALPRAGGGR